MASTDDPIDRLFAIFRRAGQEYYGETTVTQLEHALQCARLAERATAPATLIAAALLHDIGHLANPDDHAASLRGEDARHEEGGADLLAAWFGPAVSEPVRLHVAAKRYLTATASSYREALSPASRHSLELQGGPFSPDQAVSFVIQPYAAAALRLRRWDEGAKREGLAMPDLEHFRPYLAASLGAAAEGGAPSLPTARRTPGAPDLI